MATTKENIRRRSRKRNKLEKKKKTIRRRNRIEKKKQKNIRRRNRIEKKGKKKKDRISDLPEALQVRILACLDTKEAFRTSVLSKSWVSLWTRTPVLEFNNYSYSDYLFKKFVYMVIGCRDRFEKLDSLKLISPHGMLWGEFLKSVFDYAFSHGVKHLEACLHGFCKTDSWPVSLCDSLTNLKLEISYPHHRGIKLQFLGPTFKNLTVLHLSGAEITDVEPFSGFMVLESLTLLDCYFKKGTLRVHALRLSKFILLNCIGERCCCELRTPRLRFLEYRGSCDLKHEGLPVLETLSINFNDVSFYRGRKGVHDLMSLFSTLPKIKSLRVLWSTVLLLSMFPDELVRQGCPFQELKDLTMDFSHNECPEFFHDPGDKCYNSLKDDFLHNSTDAKFTVNWYNSVKDYLLYNSPDAKFTVNKYDEEELKSCLMSILLQWRWRISM